MDEHNLIARWIHALIRRRAVVLIVASVLGVVAGARTALTYSHLKSDLEELLPDTAPSVSALTTLRKRLPGLRHLGVVVDVADPKNVPAANRFLDDLKKRIETYPKDLVGEVRVDISAEREFAETHVLQMMAPEDIRKLRKAVEKRRDWDVTRAMDLDLLDEEEEPPPEIPIDELREKYERRHGTPHVFPEDRFISDDKLTAVLLVQAGGSDTGYSVDKTLLDRVKSDVKELGFPEAYAPDMRIGYASEVATRVEELEGLRGDLTISGVLVFSTVVALIAWFFGSWRSLPILGVPLVLGAVYAFGGVALPPLDIRHLNSNTAFLGSIVVGNGINTGIILLARFQEERRRGREVEGAIVGAVQGTWRPTLAAAGAASAAYGSLVLTDFRGFNQFGWIGGFGMLLCWLTTMVLAPPLISMWGPDLPTAERGSALGFGRRTLLALLLRPKLVLFVTLVLCVLGGIGIERRLGDWMEYDFSKLRRRDSWESGERYWGKRMDETLRRYLTPTVVMADTGEEARIIEARLEKLKDEGKAGGLISSVRSGAEVLRSDREESIAEAKKLRDVLTPRLKGELSQKDRELVERALTDEALKPLSVEQIPTVIVAGLQEFDGRIDRNVLVFPKLSPATWDSQRMTEFAHDLREAATIDGERRAVAGALLLSSDIATAMRADGPRATLVALFVVLVVCLLAFRGGHGSHVLLSIGAIVSLFAGVLLMLGSMAWAGEKLNFCNFVALPITFGIGADYSINMLRRFQGEGRMDLHAALTSTGGAVTLCSATTIIGFGSLLVAQNQALFSFGLFAVAGEFACLFTAIIGLPAAVQLFTRRHELATREVPPGSA